MSQNRIRAELVGKIVMTHYNNKTYRIDDIDFEKNPDHTFHSRKEDREITFAEYHERRYQLRITNRTQYMLVSRPSQRDMNRGDDRLIFLIPEFCTMTGLADDHRLVNLTYVIILWILINILWLILKKK